MSQAQLEIQLIAVLVAAACAIPGVFLILRRMALMSDAVSHAILLGIVAAFFIVEDLASPFLILAAGLTGLLTVSLTELLHRTRRVKEDAAIGLVFPLLFSLGVILIARYAGDVHLDTDAVLLGELAFAPFNRLILHGRDFGPKSLWVMWAFLLANFAFVYFFYKELKLATFDPALAMAFGFSPFVLHYALMALVSFTAVGAFDAVGSILVVALMIAPPAAAYLLTDRLSRMLVYAVLIGAAGAVGGYWLAHGLDASIAGSMAAAQGLLFGLVYLLAPGRGLLAAARRRYRQKWEFAQRLLAIHLSQHEGAPGAEFERRLENLEKHFLWAPGFAREVVRRSERNGLIAESTGQLTLTDEGRKLAKEALAE
jgi:manganese/zinc/iron transport system permease protein